MPSYVRVNVSALVVDGKALGTKIQEEVSERISSLKERGVAPHLAVVIAGDDPASHVYVRNKDCLLYTSPSPRDKRQSRMPSSA